MPIRVQSRARAESYPVRVESRLLARAGALVRPYARGGTIALVTDRTVARLYGARVERALRGAKLTVVRSVLPAGEGAKTLGSVRVLCDRWARAGLNRDALVLALGGGVVSDVAGFAASAFARGLPWVVFPTTLLAQADASIGGKVGVNLTSGKNLVGAFHQPRGVFADPDALATLAPRAFRSGLAEVAKMGVIKKPQILRQLEPLARTGGRYAPRETGALVRGCAAAKAWYVGRDERDQGIRRELNFGHTVGHALEAAYGYRAYLHGEAVSIGMAAALRLSVLHAGLNPADAEEVERLLARLGLPTRLRRSPGPRFWAALARDKKRGRKALRVVLCPAIGTAEVHELASLTSLRRVVSSLVRSS